MEVYSWVLIDLYYPCLSQIFTYTKTFQTILIDYGKQNANEFNFLWFFYMFTVSFKTIQWHSVIPIWGQTIESSITIYRECMIDYISDFKSYSLWKITLQDWKERLEKIFAYICFRPRILKVNNSRSPILLIYVIDLDFW